MPGSTALRDTKSQVRDADYEPNPARSIWIRGELDEALEDRLRPQILELTSSSGEPITLYIDSDGGSAAVGQRILELLRAANQDGTSCRLITVAVGKARSIAADIFSSGDFAIARPGALLLYHGTRILLPQAVTADFASLVVEGLKNSNSRFAASLFDKCAERFMFLLLGLRQEFDAHRASATDRVLEDVDCFQELLCQKSPPAAQKVLRRAADIWLDCYGVVTRFETEVERVRTRSETTDVEKLMLDVSASFEFERKRNNPEWSLRNGGLRNISDKFFFLDAYVHCTNGARFASLCERWAPLLFAKDEWERLSAEEQAEKFRAFFPPFWSFFVALTHALQQTENELTATDAFFLGLVDTLREDIAAPPAS